MFVQVSRGSSRSLKSFRPMFNAHCISGVWAAISANNSFEWRYVTFYVLDVDVFVRLLNEGHRIIRSILLLGIGGCYGRKSIQNPHKQDDG